MRRPLHTSPPDCLIWTAPWRGTIWVSQMDWMRRAAYPRARSPKSGDRLAWARRPWGKSRRRYASPQMILVAEGLAGSRPLRMCCAMGKVSSGSVSSHLSLHGDCGPLIDPWQIASIPSAENVSRTSAPPQQPRRTRAQPPILSRSWFISPVLAWPTLLPFCVCRPSHLSRQTPIW